MDTEFKVPTFEPKLKAAPKKENNPVDDVSELKKTPEIVTVTPIKEVTSAKNELDVVKNLPKCPYVVPTWSQPPDSSLVYSFEVLKGGQIVERVENLQNKGYWTIGKFQTNHIVMAHPTISRYHAVLQYRSDIDNEDNNRDSSESDGDGDDDKSNSSTVSTTQKPKVDKGWYLYDLNSTHGTFVNKMKVPPKTYVRLRVGYMLKFGASTRNYILQGPNFDEEAESVLTITEMKELKLKKIQEQRQKLQEEEKRREDEEKRRENEGVSWGMSEDADEETDLSHNPYASTANEELFLQDPKKTLRGFFEREGLDLEYKVDELSAGNYICKVELPITDSMGRSIVAEFTHKGKKKECVAQCALEACRILDQNGVLRQANHEPRKRKVESSDDDDDEFYDRTAEAEEKRRRKTGGDESVALSYEQLLEEEQKLKTQLIETEKRIERYQELDRAAKAKEAMDVDDLDDFMSGLSSEKQMDKADIRKCRFDLQRLITDIQKVQRLINIARPVALPPLKIEKMPTDATSQSKKSLPLFGKKKTFGFDKLKQQVAHKKNIEPESESKVDESVSIEEFDEDEHENKSKPEKSHTKAVSKAVPQREEKETTTTTTAEAAAAAAAPEEPLTDDTQKIQSKSCDVPINESAIKISTKEIETKKQDIKINEKSPKVKDNSDRIDNNDQLSARTAQLSTPSNSTSSDVSNKNKPKNRHRNKVRHQIDIDETEEDTSPQKYSGWIPPENQSGDGMTALNSKYGY